MEIEGELSGENLPPVSGLSNSMELRGIQQQQAEKQKQS